MGYWCSLKVWVQLSFKKSQILIVQSPELVTKWDPLGWNAIPDTQSLCPSPDIINSPYYAVQIFQVKSSLDVAKIDFLGCNANDEIAIMCPIIKVCININ